MLLKPVVSNQTIILLAMPVMAVFNKDPSTFLNNSNKELQQCCSRELTACVMLYPALPAWKVELIKQGVMVVGVNLVGVEDQHHHPSLDLHHC